MSIVLSCWNSSCATLNLWGDLDTKSSNSGFPGKTASRLRVKKLILAHPISWTVMTHCFPYWRAIPAFCLFYWYVAFTRTGCCPDPDLGEFLFLKAFSDIVKPSISIVKAMCVYMSLYTQTHVCILMYTDISLCTQTYTCQGSLMWKTGVCMYVLSFSVIHLLWQEGILWELAGEASEGSCWCMPWKIPFLLSGIHSWVVQILQCQPLKKLFCKFGSKALQLIDKKGMMDENFEKATCIEQVLRAQLSVWGFHFVWF